MGSQPSLSLRLVDGLTLAEPLRAALRPAGFMYDREGRARRLPRYFYEVPSWDAALATELTPHFGLWELLDVDFREAEAMRIFPRYVPCAIVLLATHLEVLREKVGTVVRVAANGGYRSPAHKLSNAASTHSWGTAANIYRIGEEMMDSQDRIDKYSRLAREVLPGIWSRPYGPGSGFAFDHVHLDLGYATVVPHDAPSEGEEEQR
ncbi:MAG: hypothetical protein KY464_06960 [Gemmatimonadetes bacterium]|nr:hypothetical protein [Gemmatimonadota bacterium]